MLPRWNQQDSALALSWLLKRTGAPQTTFRGTLLGEWGEHSARFKSHPASLLSGGVSMTTTSTEARTRLVQNDYVPRGASARDRWRVS
jgi:hypothetical protein